VYAVSGYHVRDVMVNGRWLYRNSQFQTLDYLEERRKLEAKHDELMRRIKDIKE
jgi:5-methylthioadenosine/S-adenosylhomocysteine deaminase